MSQNRQTGSGAACPRPVQEVDVLQQYIVGLDPGTHLGEAQGHRTWDPIPVQERGNRGRDRCLVGRGRRTGSGGPPSATLALGLRQASLPFG